MPSISGRSVIMNEMLCKALATVFREFDIVGNDDVVSHLLTVALAGDVGDGESEVTSAHTIITAWSADADIERKVATLAYLSNQLIKTGVCTRQELITNLIMQLDPES